MVETGYARRRAFRVTPAFKQHTREEARSLWRRAKLKQEVHDLSPLYSLPNADDEETRSYLFDAALCLSRETRHSSEIAPIMALCMASKDDNERYAAVSAVANHAEHHGDINNYLTQLMLKLQDSSEKVRMAAQRALRAHANAGGQNAAAILRLLPKNGSSESSSLERTCRSTLPPPSPEGAGIKVKELRDHIKSLTSRNPSGAMKSRIALETYIKESPENARRVAGLLLTVGISDPPHKKLHEKCMGIIQASRGI